MPKPTPITAPTRPRRAKCVHHWVLGEPADGKIHGCCRFCNRKRVYPSNPEGGDRFDDYRELTASSSYHTTYQERLSAA